MVFSSKVSIILSIGFVIEEDNFLAKKLLLFSKFLIITLSPNFFFKIWSAFPIPSIRPSFKAVFPVQNSPVQSHLIYSYIRE